MVQEQEDAEGRLRSNRLADISIYLAEQNPGLMTDAIRKINKPKGLYNKNDYLEYVKGSISIMYFSCGIKE